MGTLLTYIFRQRVNFLCYVTPHLTENFLTYCVRVKSTFHSLPYKESGSCLWIPGSNPSNRTVKGTVPIHLLKSIVVTIRQWKVRLVTETEGCLNLFRRIKECFSRITPLNLKKKKKFESSWCRTRKSIHSLKGTIVDPVFSTDGHLHPLIYLSIYRKLNRDYYQ